MFWWSVSILNTIILLIWSYKQQWVAVKWAPSPCITDSMVGFPLKNWACQVQIFFLLRVLFSSQTSPVEPGMCFSTVFLRRGEFHTLFDILKANIYCPNIPRLQIIFYSFRSDPRVFPSRMHIGCTFIFKSLNLQTVNYISNIYPTQATNKLHVCRTIAMYLYQHHSLCSSGVASVSLSEMKLSWNQLSLALLCPIFSF